MGTVYLIHFARPLAHARHYLGWSSDLPSRIAAHRKGQGARLMEVISQAGIPWEVVRTWEGSRRLERALKERGGHAAALCPLCRPAYLARERARSARRRSTTARTSPT